MRRSRAALESELPGWRRTATRLVERDGRTLEIGRAIHARAERRSAFAVRFYRSDWGDPVLINKRLNRFEARPGLSQKHFTRIAQQGFGDGLNSYAHSMAFFQGKLYVGTTRGNIPLIKKRSADIALATWPVTCPADPYDLDLRAEVWCYDPIARTWERVYKAPTIIGRHGRRIPRDFGYRGMAVYDPPGDGQPILFIGTWSPAAGPGCLVLSSTNGIIFEPASEPGLKGLPVTVIRSFAQLGDRFFTTPAGTSSAQSNVSGHAVIYESRDPAGGEWEAIGEYGLGDAGNKGVFEMAVLGEYLYAGLFNLEGYQIWRCVPEGPKPYRWERVITRGAYRGPENQLPACMLSFNGALYVGGAIQGGGLDRKNKVGPAAAELIRIFPDNTWDLIVGEKRATPDGPKKPLSGWGPGFDNFFNGYFWRLCEHDGWLYLSTFDWSIFLAYANRDLWPAPLCDLVNSLGEQFIIDHAGASVFRSLDGENWVNVTDDGFENPFNIGIRTMVSTPHGLFMGTANPFGPELYPFNGDRAVSNERGGCEIFLGRSGREET